MDGGIRVIFRMSSVVKIRNFVFCHLSANPKVQLLEWEYFITDNSTGLDDGVSHLFLCVMNIPNM